MSLKFIVSFFSIAVVISLAMATLLLTSATNDSTNLVIAQGPVKFGFNLTGSDEVPSVQTNATAKVEI
jgi:hypothetical protein